MNFAPHPSPWQVLDSWRRTRVALLLPQVFENVLFRVGQGGLFTSWDETVYAILLNLHIVSFEPGADKIPRMDRASLQAKRQTPGGTELRNCLRAVTIEASSAWQFWNTCLYLNHLSCFSYYIILYYTQYIYIYIFNIYNINPLPWTRDQGVYERKLLSRGIGALEIGIVVPTAWPSTRTKNGEIFWKLERNSFDFNIFQSLWSTHKSHNKTFLLPTT